MLRQTAFGRAVPRVDGRLKVTGAATYAYEYDLGRSPAYGHIVGAAIACGRVVGVDTAAALAAPGVLHVMTHGNVPAQHGFGPVEAKGPETRNRFTFARPCFADDKVRYFGEPVALVVAESLEQARDAASLLGIEYEEQEGAFDLQGGLGGAYRPNTVNGQREPDSAFGNLELAMASSPTAVDATYRTPYQKHNAMEPHAAVASWRDGRLTLHTSTQSVPSVRQAVANTLMIDPAQVRIVSAYVGGGFGGKIAVGPETVLAALAARLLGRPVKVAQTRQQTFAIVGHRPEMVHRLRLGADRNGGLQAYGHEVWMQTARHEEFAEQAAVPGRSLYQAPNRISRHRLVRMDVTAGDTMRAPGEASGLLAVECAMDELAHELGIDPVELRIRNEPLEDPEKRVPFSTRNLVACLREGADRFGWHDRPQAPASRREGRSLIGYGMAAGVRPNLLRPGKAAVALDAGGRLVARLNMTDIGTGTYTILAQVAADGLGVQVADVTVLLGDSDFPDNFGSGGSVGAASSALAVRQACLELRRQLVALAISHDDSPLRVTGDGAEAEFADGRLRIGNRSEALGPLLRRIAPDGLEASGSHDGAGQSYKDFSQNSFGAQFAEVAVDADTAEVRVRRMLGVFAAGRVFNPRTAHSQLIGGMIWGIGGALLEEGVLDRRLGRFVNNDLAEYHVAVNADAADIQAFILDEDDQEANAFGTKGIGELGICGAGAAVANAVFNATGVRVRDFPITLDKLLPGLPE